MTRKEHITSEKCTREIQEISDGILRLGVSESWDPDSGVVGIMSALTLWLEGHIDVDGKQAGMVTVRAAKAAFDAAIAHLEAYQPQPIDNSDN